MPRPEAHSHRLLTPRQLEVLELMAKGLTNREIGGVLGIGAGTVKNYVSAIIEALDVTNRTEAAVALQELGLARASAAPQGADAAERASFSVAGFGDRPAIAVLPFDDLSAEGEHAHLADGLVEDLITRLACYRWFPIIARNSTFTYKGRAVDVRQVSRELGARYVVEGSVRADGSRVRVAVQLVDGARGEHVLAERYDREIVDLFRLQDELVEDIVGAIDPGVSQLERLRAVRKAPPDLSAWDCVARGMFHVYRGARDDLLQARRLFERAIEENPFFAPAWEGLSQVHCFELFYGFSADRPRSLSEAVRAAERSVESDPGDPVAHGTLALARALTLQTEAAVAAFEHAIELNPSYGVACWGLAALELQRERIEEAHQLVAKAMRLSPHDPVMHMMLGFLVLVHCASGAFDEALAVARRAVQLRPDQPFGYALEAACCIELSRPAEAGAAWAQLRKLAPAFRPGVLVTFAPARVRERLETIWRRLG
jgi:TolB-like protein/DNA-binding CsgD family transcriptional regulator/cytochrome c-type biogenesis protein CcmH/NrfG